MEKHPYMDLVTNVGGDIVGDTMWLYEQTKRFEKGIIGIDDISQAYHTYGNKHFVEHEVSAGNCHELERYLLSCRQEAVSRHFAKKIRDYEARKNE